MENSRCVWLVKKAGKQSGLFVSVEKFSKNSNRCRQSLLIAICSDTSWVKIMELASSKLNSFAASYKSWITQRSRKWFACTGIASCVLFWHCMGNVLRKKTSQTFSVCGTYWLHADDHRLTRNSVNQGEHMEGPKREENSEFTKKIAVRIIRIASGVASPLLGIEGPNLHRVTPQLLARSYICLFLESSPFSTISLGVVGGRINPPQIEWSIRIRWKENSRKYLNSRCRCRCFPYTVRISGNVCTRLSMDLIIANSKNDVFVFESKYRGIVEQKWVIWREVNEQRGNKC